MTVKFETDKNVIFGSVLRQRALISSVSVSREKRGVEPGAPRFASQWPEPMMTCRKVLIALLMFLALPINGTAQAMAFDTHHDMSPSSIISDVAAPELTTPSHECCDPDELTSVCENGQECKTSSLLQLALDKVVSPTLPPRPALLLTGQAPFRAPDIVWHPPRR